MPSEEADEIPEFKILVEQKKMSISRLIFFLVWLDPCVAEIFGNNCLVTSLIRHLNILHVHLLKSDDGNENEEFFKLQKLMRDLMPWLYISVVSTSNLASLVESASGASFKSSIVLFNASESIADKYDLVRVSIRHDISPFKWILIADSYGEENYEELNIPYNCEFIIAIGSRETGYEIHELYDSLNVKKIRNFLGKWSPDDGLKMVDAEIGQRRRNLRGTVFNITSNTNNPCSVQSFESSAGSVLMCIHFHLFNLFGERSNFSINWLPQNLSGQYGSTFLPKYLSDTIQFTIFEVNSNPAEGATVMWPTTSTPIAVYTSYAGRTFGWSTYIYPFSKQMWLAVFVWFLVSAAVISTAEYITLSSRRRRNGKRLWFKMWSKYIFLAYSAFCFQNEGVEPERISLRILLFFTFLIPAALMPGYSAALTSYLTVINEIAPFVSLEGLSRAKDYKLGHVASFNLSVFLDRNSEDEVVRTLYKDIIIPPNEMPLTEHEGVQRMCREKFSYLCTVYTVLAVPPKCSFYSLDRPLIIAVSMMPVKTNNPYRHMISRSLRDFIYSGVFFIEAVRVLPGTVTNPVVEEDETELEAIEFGNVIAIIALLGFGILLSILLLLLELLSVRRRPTDFTHALLPY